MLTDMQQQKSTEMVLFCSFTNHKRGINESKTSVDGFRSDLISLSIGLYIGLQELI